MGPGSSSPGQGLRLQEPGLLAPGQGGLSRWGWAPRTQRHPEGGTGKARDTRGRSSRGTQQTHVASEGDPGRDPLHGLQHDHAARPGLPLHPLHPHGHRGPLPAAAHRVYLRARTGWLHLPPSPEPGPPLPGCGIFRLGSPADTQKLTQVQARCPTRAQRPLGRVLTGDQGSLGHTDRRAERLRLPSQHSVPWTGSLRVGRTLSHSFQRPRLRAHLRTRSSTRPSPSYTHDAGRGSRALGGPPGPAGRQRPTR